MKILNDYALIINERLQSIFPVLDENSYREGEMPELLARSMKYSLLAGGKRLRPAMMIAAMDMLGCDYTQWIDFACAIEMIHSYSLIHDDLPGMDDDTMRRGRPTNHVVFGVGQAILAGDGLLNVAFETMLRCALENSGAVERALHAIYEVATGAGVTGMIGGQVMDLWCERQNIASAEALSYIQRDKTACLFIYPLRAAGWISGADDAQISALGRYGEAFGRIFQATDDLLDVLGDPELMGKTLGKDAAQGKLTMVSLYGIEGTQKKIQQELDAAMQALEIFGSNADFFRDLVRSMVNRCK